MIKIRKTLIIFGLIHAMVMLGFTTWASYQNSILNVGYLFDDAWFIATLADTYLGFLVVYLWIALTRHHFWSRLIHLIAFISLGNIAIGLAIAWRAYAMGKDLTLAKFFKGDLDG